MLEAPPPTSELEPLEQDPSRSRRGLWTIVIVYAAAVLATSGPWASARQTGSWVVAWFQGLGFAPATAAVLHDLVRKVGHFTAYAVFAWLVWRALPPLKARRGLIAVVLALLLALADEGLQSLTPARTGTLHDVVLDVAGALAFVLVARALSPSSRS